MAAASDRPVFLVGFMGSGKSTVGRLVAERLGWTFVDLDRQVEQATGSPIERLFREHGEQTFRDAEWSALRALRGRRRAVVATGGGIFEGERQRAWMQDEGTTVWLVVALETARERVGRGEGRPLWSAAEDDRLQELFDRRQAAYALADLRIETDGAGAEEVARKVLDAICD